MPCEPEGRHKSKRLRDDESGERHRERAERGTRRPPPPPPPIASSRPSIERPAVPARPPAPAQTVAPSTPRFPPPKRGLFVDEASQRVLLLVIECGVLRIFAKASSSKGARRLLGRVDLAHNGELSRLNNGRLAARSSRPRRWVYNLDFFDAESHSNSPRPELSKEGASADDDGRQDSKSQAPRFSPFGRGASVADEPPSPHEARHIQYSLARDRDTTAAANSWAEAAIQHGQALRVQTDEWLERARAGCDLFRYNYTNSKRQRRFFFLSDDLSCLCWMKSSVAAQCPREARMALAKDQIQMVDLSACLGVLHGPLTSTFRNAARNKAAGREHGLDDCGSLCFSLLYDRSVDLAATCSADAEAWLMSLEYVLVTKFQMDSSMPLTRTQLLCNMARIRLRVAAHERHMTMRAYLTRLVQMKAGVSPKFAGVVQDGPGEESRYTPRGSRVVVKQGVPTATPPGSRGVPPPPPRLSVRPTGVLPSRPSLSPDPTSTPAEQQIVSVAIQRRLSPFVGALSGDEPDSVLLDGLVTAARACGWTPATVEVPVANARDDHTERALRDAIKAKGEAEQRFQQLSAELQGVRASLKTAEATCASLSGGLSSRAQGLADSLAAAKAEHSRLRDACEKVRSFNDSLFHIASAAEAAGVAHRELQARFVNLTAERRRLHNMVFDLKGNIRLFVRVRPLSEKELMGEQPDARTVQFDGEEKLALYNQMDRSLKWFEFHTVFHPRFGQDAIFREAEPLATSVLDGYNCCIFAYGQTGSGKTFTMSGTPEQPGLNTNILKALFVQREARKEQYKITIRISVCEIYNEQLRNLLEEEGSKKKTSKVSRGLDVKVNADGTVSVVGLPEWEANSAEEVLEMMELAAGNRATTATDMNLHSSRSHSIVTVKTECAPVNPDECPTGKAIYLGKIHLIDLAGSERVLKSGVTGQALEEAKAINKSLSALGNVIQGLNSRDKHVPYRDSKLTLLLKDSLAGDSKVLCISQISPSQESIAESLSTLGFASRARNVELGRAQRNVA